MISVYLSSSFADKQETEKKATQLAALNMEVTSGWLNHNEEDINESNTEILRHWGEENLQDIDRASVFCLVIDKPSTGGGLFMELGYALARNKYVMVVGQLSYNPFYWLPAVHRLSTWEQAVQHLQTSGMLTGALAAKLAQDLVQKDANDATPAQLAENPAATKHDASLANQRQVGGAHYSQHYAHTAGIVCAHCGQPNQVQHWDFMLALNLGYFEGQITKYVTRWRNKRGLEDLEKAKHFLEKLIEWEKQHATITKEK